MHLQYLQKIRSTYNLILIFRMGIISLMAITLFGGIFQTQSIALADSSDQAYRTNPKDSASIEQQIESDSFIPQFSATNGEVELLNNGEFEGNYNYTAPYWNLNKWNNASAQTSPTNGINGLGQKVITTNLPTNSGVYFRQYFDIQKGHVYRFSIWLRSDEQTIVRVQFRKDSLYYDVGASKIIALSDRWQQVIIEGGLPQDASGSAGIVFMTTGSVEIDQASLIDVTTQALSNKFSPEAVPQEFFGIHFNKPGALIRSNTSPDIGYGAIRLWDDVITWRDIEPNKGEWDFSRFDLIITNLSKNTKDFIYTFGMAPEWARSDPSDVGSIPANIDDWRTYVRTVAKRYQGQIQYYEIWNEANFSGFSSISPKEFVELTRVAREELLAIDPTIKVLSPNIDDLGLPFLDEFLFYGGSEYIDIISYHVYPDVNYPEDSLGTHIAVSNLRDNYDLQHIPVWNTEGSLKYQNISSTPELDRASTSRFYLFQRMMGVDRSYWYAWDIFGWADVVLVRLATDDYTSTRTAGDAYRETVNWLLGKTIISSSVENINGLWHMVLENEQGQLEHILWNYDSQTTFSIPEDWNNPILHTLTGQTRILDLASVEIGIEPVLISTTTNAIHLQSK